jgi:hypothetical protein
MDDEVDASKHLEQAIGEPLEEFRAMRVGHHSDASRHPVAAPRGEVACIAGFSLIPKSICCFYATT